MKTSLRIVVVLFLAYSGVYDGYAVAGYNWIINPTNGHRYTTTMVNSNWADAEAEAVSLGGHLVTINDEPENAWLTANFGGYYDVEHNGDPWASLLWIGLIFDDSMGFSQYDIGGWTWVSGEPMDFTGLWYNGDPATVAKGGGSYAYLHPSTHPDPGTWYNAVARDIDPGSYPCGIVEVVPEPATLALLGIGSLLLRKKRG